MDHDECVKHRKPELRNMVRLSVEQLLEGQHCRTGAPERECWL
jgi:hypothetical protein